MRDDNPAYARANVGSAGARYGKNCSASRMSGPLNLYSAIDRRVVGLPRVERARSLRSAPTALRGFDLLGDGGDDSIAMGVE